MSGKQTKKEIANLVVNCRSQYISVMKFFDLMKIQQSHYTDFTYAGNGGFSFVLKAKNKTSGQIVALKVTECHDNDISGMQQVQDEYRLLKQFSNCKYIVQVFNCFFLTVEESSDEDSSNDEEEEQKNVEKNIKKQKNEKKLFFVVEQEFCQTNLENFFAQCRLKQSYPCKQQKEVMAIQMLDSVAYLHRFDLLHRDIKPSNFLLQLDQYEFPTVKICKKQSNKLLNLLKIYILFKLKIGDLSFASALQNNKSRITVSKIKGTQAYTAPEVEKGIYKKGSDIFSLGLVLLELDNIQMFNFNETTNEDKLEIKFDKIYQNYQIDRKSFIYSIAIQCLNYQAEKRKFAIDLLIQFIQENQNYLNIELSSVINRNEKHFKNLMQMFDVLKQKPFQTQEYKSILKLLQNIPKYNTNFEFISVGAKGLVLGAFNKTLGIQTVLKIQQVESQHEVVQEVGIMRDCQMPLVIKFYGYFYLSVNKKDDFVVYEIEKCSGNLKQYFTRLQKEKILLSEKQKMQIAVQIIDVVNYLNQNGIVHRDIKLDNILYIQNESEVPTIKLADFDQSRKMPYDLYRIDGELTIEYFPVQGICGTFGYIAPEFFDNTLYTFECEIFSVGVCLALIDNFEKLEPLIQKKAQDYFFGFKLPFEQNFHVKEEVINRKSQIYDVLLQTVVFQQKQRKPLSQILLNFEKLGYLYYSKIFSNTSSIHSDFVKHFKVLSLDHKKQNLIKDDAKKIASEIAKCRTISTLRIDFDENNIGSDGAKAVASEIAKCPTLSTLSLWLYENNIGSDGAKAVASEIAKCPTLSTLSLSLQSNNIGSDGAKAVASEIAKCPTLSTLSLWLGENNIGSDGAKAVASEIAKCPTLSTLSLWLGENNIGSDGAKAVASEIAKCPTLSTLSLDLYENNIGSDGAKAVASEIAKCPTLSTLSLDLQSNNIGSDGAKAVASEIAKCPTLSTLSLDLQSNNIGSDGAKAVASEIAKCPTLQNLRIDLRFNKLNGDDGFMKLLPNDIQKKIQC
ncbi:hypothetical protein ABPG74_019779 [Tetrahymena malaccensis]